MRVRPAAGATANGVATVYRAGGPAPSARVPVLLRVPLAPRDWGQRDPYAFARPGVQRAGSFACLGLIREHIHRPRPGAGRAIMGACH